MNRISDYFRVTKFSGYYALRGAIPKINHQVTKSQRNTKKTKGFKDKNINNFVQLRAFVVIVLALMRSVGTS